MTQPTQPTVDDDTIANAVQLACRAPSLHNSQPWRWVAEDSELQLFADPSRNVRSTDESGRETLLGCGVVLDHLRVAMAAAVNATRAAREPVRNTTATHSPQSSHAAGRSMRRPATTVELGRVRPRLKAHAPMTASTPPIWFGCTPAAKPLRGRPRSVGRCA